MRQLLIAGALTLALLATAALAPILPQAQPGVAYAAGDGGSE